jgi:hypothetical protein
MGIASAEASGSWAALAALADGPSPETHDQALAFAHDLIRLAPARRSGWERLAGRCDPAGAVREVLAEAGAPAGASGRR